MAVQGLSTTLHRILLAGEIAFVINSWLKSYTLNQATIHTKKLWLLCILNLPSINSAGSIALIPLCFALICPNSDGFERRFATPAVMLILLDLCVLQPCESQIARPRAEELLSQFLKTILMTKRTRMFNKRRQRMSSTSSQLLESVPRKAWR